MWFVFAITASVLWGLQYAVGGQILKTVSATSYILLVSLASIAIYLPVVALSKGGLRGAAEGFSRVPWYYTLTAFAVTAMAHYCISASIQSKSATLASLVEISYPFFTALFAVLLFKEMQLSQGTLCGGLLIAAGTFVVMRFG